jgi:endonuclease III
MLTFSKTIARLKSHYGEPKAPPAEGPFELVIWENACYLLPDERRLEVFESLRHAVGLNAEAIHRASDEVLLPLAKRGGMRPETRTFRWREIAQITLTQFSGDLSSILRRPNAEAKRALKQFPTIGDPGAEKILLFCGLPSGLPLESNGLRVLVRLGWGRLQKSYSATYRSVQDDLGRNLPSDPHSLQQAHLLLREHGKTLCKDKAPLCHECPLARDCDYATKQTASEGEAAAGGRATRGARRTRTAPLVRR